MSDEQNSLESYRPYLLFLARIHLYRDMTAKVDASDIVQQAMLQAHDAAAQFRGTTPAERQAWLRQILARTLSKEVRKLHTRKRDIHRERSIEQQLNQSTSQMHEWLAADESGPGTRAERAEQVLQVAEAMEKIPGDQRDAIILHYWNSMPIQRVAESMDRSTSSVAGLIHRGLKNLRKQLS